MTELLSGTLEVQHPPHEADLQLQHESFDEGINVILAALSNTLNWLSHLKAISRRTGIYRYASSKTCVSVIAGSNKNTVNAMCEQLTKLLNKECPNISEDQHRTLFSFMIHLQMGVLSRRKHQDTSDRETEVIHSICDPSSAEEATNSGLLPGHTTDILQAYVCVFVPCTLDGFMFRTQSDWAAHIREEHCRFWVCPVRAHRRTKFETREQYLEHLTSEHAGLFAQSQHILVANSSQCYRKELFEKCPLCGIVRSDCENLEDHVVHHIKRLVSESYTQTLMIYTIHEHIRHVGNP